MLQFILICIILFIIVHQFKVLQSFCLRLLEFSNKSESCTRTFCLNWVASHAFHYLFTSHHITHTFTHRTAPRIRGGSIPQPPLEDGAPREIR